MKLVFVHGWALDATTWNGVAAALPGDVGERIDRGYFGKEQTLPASDDPCVLVGHSLGFLYGLSLPRNWKAWIAINSFPRFVTKTGKIGCVPPAALRDMRIRLQADAHKTLADFHSLIGAKRPDGEPNIERLRQSLDELRDFDSADVTGYALPGLVLASKNDPLVPQEISTNLAENKDILWHDTTEQGVGGHILPHSDPEFCAKAIKDFLEKHGLAST